MPYKEKAIEKKYYTIGEVATRLGVATSVIRFWESEFPVINPQKNRKGNRKFTVKDVEIVEKIYYLIKEKGLTLAGVKKHIKSIGLVEDENAKTVESLKRIKVFLEELKTRMP